jgi:branched-chain amino acid transport system ATP-binding protein
MTAPPPVLLAVSHLTTAYGAIRAVDDISFVVQAGSVVTLIGANGAGKSTTLNTISGVLKPRQGHITFDGQDITGWRADRIAARGLLQVPEGRQILAPLSVQENMLMGAYLRRDRQVHTDLELLLEQFPQLNERRMQAAGSLSGGEQQMLAIARALMGRPRMLMLDEPSLGLAPLVVRDVFRLIQQIKAAGTTILLIEQNARKALEVADFGYVLERGSIVVAGQASTLRDDPAIVAAYLGKH